MFRTARHTLAHFRRSGGAAFVAVASVDGIAGTRGWPAYGATKHAVIEPTKSVALDNGPDGIRVNDEWPNWVETPLVDCVMAKSDWEPLAQRIPLGRLATAREVASAVAHLASADATCTHGAVYLVDGGERAGTFTKAAECSPEVRSASRVVDLGPDRIPIMRSSPRRSTSRPARF